MDHILDTVAHFILKRNGLAISGIIEDRECRAYSGCSFQTAGRNILFRKAKRTPKKEGYFVTLWKRDDSNQTQPLSLADPVDFYMIAVAQEDQSGFFFFPKSILGEKGILTAGNKEGKRGFRVYTNWDLGLNKQAEGTKAWQSNYFIDLGEMKDMDASGFMAIINQH